MVKKIKKELTRTKVLGIMVVMGLRFLLEGYLMGEVGDFLDDTDFSNRGLDGLEEVYFGYYGDCEIVGRLCSCFRNIRYRCNNPKCKIYKYYGGRNIKNFFTSFEDFYSYVTIDLGLDTYDKIVGLEIHRIENDKGYEKGNIEFLTRKAHAAKHKKIRNNNLLKGTDDDVS